MAADGKLAVELSINGPYSAQMTRLQQGFKQLQKTVQETGHAGVSEMQAMSGAVRSLEGSMNTRAVERYLSQFKLLAGIARAAFPIVGATALIGIVVRLTEEFTKFNDKVKNSATNMRDAFSTLNGTMEMANAQVELSNVKLQNQINKLEGKPENHLAEAMVEGKIEALKLADALGEVASKEAEIIKNNSVGVGDMLEQLALQLPKMMLNPMTAGAIIADLQKPNYGLQDNTKKDDAEFKNDQFNLREAVRGGNQGQINAAQNTAVNAAQRQLNGYLTALKTATDANSRAMLQGLIEAREDFIKSVGLRESMMH